MCRTLNGILYISFEPGNPPHNKPSDFLPQAKQNSQSMDASKTTFTSNIQHNPEDVASSVFYDDVTKNYDVDDALI